MWIGLQISRIFPHIWWINIALAILVIFFHRRDPRTTVFWVMVLLFLPGLGFILYLFFGQDYRKRNMFLLKKKQDEILRTVMKTQRDDFIKGKYPYRNSRTGDYNELVLLNLTGKESFYTDNNQVDLLFDGKDKFRSLFHDLENAKESIDLQYYIFKNDDIGKKFINILERKAKEGVQIRVIYDAVGGRFLTPHAFKSLEEAGGKVAKFFPGIFTWFNIRVNYRNHRKIAVIDNKIGYIGGYNVGDEYLGKKKRFGYWRDTHLRIVGNGVWGMKVRFLKDWYYASEDDSQQDPLITQSIASQGNAGVQIVASGPDTQVEHIKFGMIKMISEARERIIIQTPYFIPDESLRDALIVALCTGVKVEIMIPCKPDHPFVYWSTLSHVGDLMHYGAKVYIYENGFLHAKMLLVDDYLSTVGSANMDIRSFSLNFEANAFIYDTSVNQRLYQQYLIDCKNSKHLTEEDYENRSRWIKVKESVSRLLSPIL